MSSGVTFSFAHSTASDSSSVRRRKIFSTAPLQFGDGRALVRNFLHVPLMFQLDQRFAYQRNACAQLLCDLALDDRLAGLNDPAQNRFLE